MSARYQFVVILTTPDGRVTHGLTNDPVRLLAMRVADGSLSAKQAAAADVYAVSPSIVDKVALDAAIKFHRLVNVALSNPAPIRKAILSGEMAQNELEHLREELMSRIGGGDYAPPWPFREERDELPDELAERR